MKYLLDLSLQEPNAHILITNHANKVADERYSNRTSFTEQAHGTRVGRKRPLLELQHLA